MLTAVLASTDSRDNGLGADIDVTETMQDDARHKGSIDVGRLAVQSPQYNIIKLS